MDYDEPYWVEVEWDFVGPYWYRMGTRGINGFSMRLYTLVLYGIKQD